MDRTLTHQEEIEAARLKLRLIAERAELQADLARRRGTGLPASVLRSAEKLPPGALLGVAGAGLLTVVGGFFLVRQPKVRQAVLLALVRFLTR